MYSKFTSITPKEAALWLDTKNSNNRPISQSTVDRYVQEIKAGRWRSNGSPPEIENLPKKLMKDLL